MFPSGSRIRNAPKRIIPCPSLIRNVSENFIDRNQFIPLPTVIPMKNMLEKKAAVSVAIPHPRTR